MGQGQDSPDISGRRGFIPVSLKFKIWPSQHLILYVIIDCNQSTYKKLHVVLGLLPGMFLRDENILIKIK